MNHAEKCPVCAGNGRVQNMYQHGGTVPCPGCAGRGWIVVPNEVPVFVNIPPLRMPEKGEQGRGVGIVP